MTEANITIKSILFPIELNPFFHSHSISVFYSTLLTLPPFRSLSPIFSPFLRFLFRSIFLDAPLPSTVKSMSMTHSRRKSLLPNSNLFHQCIETMFCRFSHLSQSHPLPSFCCTLLNLLHPLFQRAPPLPRLQSKTISQDCDQIHSLEQFCGRWFCGRVHETQSRR